MDPIINVKKLSIILCVPRVPKNYSTPNSNKSPNIESFFFFFKRKLMQNLGPTLGVSTSIMFTTPSRLGSGCAKTLGCVWEFGFEINLF